MNDKFTNPHDELDELLTQTSQDTKPSQQFTVILERQLRQAHEAKPKRNRIHFTRKQTVSAVAWTAMLVVFALALNWTLKSIAPVPTSVPAANGTTIPSVIVTDVPDKIKTEATPISNGEGYDWRDTNLYLNAPLPDAPAQANIYLLKDEQLATADQAHALAEQLGIQGEVYVTENPITGGTDYLVTDGRQSLSMTTDRYFTYAADMSKVINNFKDPTPPDAEITINNFLQTHGFDFPHTVQKANLYTGYEVVPLSPDGFPMRYEFFSSRPMRVMLDDDGQVLQIEANLMNYEPIGSQPFSIISAQEAFEKLLDDTIPGGKIESAVSSPITGTTEWMREYPINETINLYGYASSVPALDPSKPALVQIDGFTLTGNTSGMDSLERNTFVEATGQFIDQSGITLFNVVSWQPSPFMQDGIVGTLQSENGQIVFITEQGEKLIIQPDLPPDLSLPFENAFVVGVRKDNNIYEWSLIDDRAIGGGGGGGGGGGTGFYKLNLSGTPVPFPPATQTSTSGAGNYTVQEGDTLISIAQAHGTTVEELMQANGIAMPGIIIIGQQLVIPGVLQDGTRFEGLRGTLTISIYTKPDGSRRTEYILNPKSGESPLSSMLLEGDNLQSLMTNQNRPIDIWGTLDRYDEYNRPIVKVERYEIPYPDLKIQLFMGTEENVQINGQTVILLTTTDGTKYILLRPNGDLDQANIDPEKPNLIVEGMTLPDEIFEGYRTLRYFNGGLAIDPMTNEPSDFSVTADQPYNIDEIVGPGTVESYTPPALTIEKVELMYYVTNPHWQVDRLDGSPLYIQPVWRFYGHYENGGEFEVIVQALKEEYLLPELDTYVQGG